MTNPVILLGTQSNGETLPVQVDATGRLVAEGLQGSEGPQGPQGPPGPEGPSGIELPPNPYEGAYLGWLNNGLAWIGQYVPIPEGVFGPITSWDPQSGYLQVAGPIPETVGNGVYVYQCNESGVYFTEGWDTSKVWSDGAAQEDPTNGFSWTQCFDGDLATGGGVPNYNSITQVIFDPLVANRVRIYGKRGNSSSTPLIINDGTDAQAEFTTSYKWVDVTAYLPANKRFTGWTNNRDGGQEELVYTNAVEVNGDLLVNTDKSLNMRVNQLFQNGLIGVANTDVEFTPGAYLKVPAQRVAPWVLYGVDPTSLIDHLRSS